MATQLSAFAVLAAVVILLAILTAWSRRQALLRWTATLLAVAVVGGAYPTFVGMLSLPRSADEEWWHRNAATATVTGIYIREGVALYLYLLLPGVPEPRSYSFAWSEETKKLTDQLVEALDAAEGGGVGITWPFAPSLETERPKTAHPLPQPKLPAKRQPPPPLEFGI